MTIDRLLGSSTSALFVLFLLIGCNFLAELFGCQLQELLRSSMIMKHIVGFMTLTFFAVFVDTSLSVAPASQVLATSFAVYCWFILISRTSLFFTGSVICILFVVYILNLYRTRMDKNDTVHKRRISKAQSALTVIAFVLTLVGVGVYANRRRIAARVHGKPFDWVKFFVGHIHHCQNM